MEQISQYSKAIDEHEVFRTGSFTSLPIRIHHDDDVANLATCRLLADWKAYFNDGNDREYSSCLSEVGNLCSLMFSECKPNRLSILTYLTDLGFIHDGKVKQKLAETSLTAIYRHIRGDEIRGCCTRAR